MKQLEIDFYNEWKQVPGYEGLYDLRNDGLLYSYPRETTKGGYSYGQKKYNGYLKHSLSKNGEVVYNDVHKWVWITFVGPIPKGYDVHHINHNKKDNRLENLCLIEHKKHCDLHLKDKSKPVVQYTLDGEFVAEYPSIIEAERQTGIANTHISECCRKKIKNRYGYSWIPKTAGGFVWKYKEVA